jgi:hypothetical protein
MTAPRRPFSPKTVAQLAAAHRRAPRSKSKPPLRVTKFFAVRRGALLGFARVHWDAAGLTFNDIPIFIKSDGDLWAGLPSTPILDQTGKHHVVDGKRQYKPTAEWRSRARAAWWNEKIAEQIRARFPEALLLPAEAVE